MKRRIMTSLLLLTLILTPGCSMFRWGSVSREQAKSSTHAAGIQQASRDNAERARQIQDRADKAQKELKRDVRDGVLPEHNAKAKSTRWTEVRADAEAIEDNATINSNRSYHIMKINDGKIELSWWGKVLIYGFLALLLLGIVSYVTFILKQWGILSVIRVATEGTAGLVAKSWIDDDNRDTTELSPEMYKKAVEIKQNSRVTKLS